MMIASVLVLGLAAAPAQDPPEKSGGDLFEWARQLDELDLSMRLGDFGFEFGGNLDIEAFVFGAQAPGIHMEDPLLRSGRYNRAGNQGLWAASPEALGRLNLILDTFYQDWLEGSMELRIDGTTAVGNGGGGVRFEQLWIRGKVPDRPELNFQLGKFAAPIGNFIPRSASRKNPLTTWPLVYDLPTALTTPGDGAADLRTVRDAQDIKDWYVPIWQAVYGWGFMAHGSWEALSWAVSIQSSAPATLMDTWDENFFDPKYFSGYVHVAYQLDITTVVGLSYSRGPYQKGPTLAGGPGGGVPVPDPDRYEQTLVGVDVSFAIGYLELFAEFFWSEFETAVAGDLDLLSWYVEGKYTLLPGFWVATRIAQISFSTIDDGFGPFTWDHEVIRWEFGAGYLFTDNLFAKVTVQLNFHTSGIDPDDHLVMFQFGLGF
jgi:hypothetical protein